MFWGFQCLELVVSSCLALGLSVPPKSGSSNLLRSNEIGRAACWGERLDSSIERLFLQDVEPMVRSRSQYGQDMRFVEGEKPVL